MARASTLKVVGFNILALSSVAIGLFTGYIQPIFVNDSSHLTYAIAATMAAIVFFSIYNCFRPQTWIKAYIKFQEANLRLLGLMGTITGLSIIVGIIYTVATQGSPDGDLITHVLVSFANGLRTAFNPMLVAIACWYWVRHLLYFSRHDK